MRTFQVVSKRLRMLILLREGRQIQAIYVLLVWLRREESVFNVLAPSHIILVTPGNSEAISFRLLRDYVIVKLAMGRLKHLRVYGLVDTVVVFVIKVVAVVDRTGNVQRKEQSILVVLRRKPKPEFHHQIEKIVERR